MSFCIRARAPGAGQVASLSGSARQERCRAMVQHPPAVCTQRPAAAGLRTWKQLPPKPTLAFRNLGPMRESVPMDLDTCCTSAPAGRASGQHISAREWALNCTRAACCGAGAAAGGALEHWLPCTCMRTSGLAKRGDGVDRGDALRQHGVGRQLGQLRGPQVGAQDALAGHPVGVHTAWGAGAQRRQGGQGWAGNTAVQ